MLIWLVLFLLAVCVFLVIYPYVLYPCILRLLPVRAVAPVRDWEVSVSLLFCAFNEGSVIGEKLQNVEMLKAARPDLEVLAFDDGSQDDTLSKLAARPDLVTVIEGSGRQGKAHGMKQLAARATGEVLVFSDANVLLDDAAIENLSAWYGDPNVGGVCGTLRYLNSGESATATVGGAYWRLEEKLKALESRSGNVMGADGSIFSVRRELYPEFPDTVLDDLTVSMEAVFAGKRLIKVEDVVAYERLVASRSDEFSRKVRIAARAFHTHRFLRPKLASMSIVDKFKYFSRKYVRWFGGLFLVLGAVLAVVAAYLLAEWAGVGLAAVLALFVAFAPRLAGNGPVGLAVDTGLALVATFVGVVRAVRGQTMATWSPAKSR